MSADSQGETMPEQLTIIQLLDRGLSGKEAMRQLKRMTPDGTAPGLFQTGSNSTTVSYGAVRVSAPFPGCHEIKKNGHGTLHGTDCAISVSVAADLDAKTITPLPDCSRNRKASDAGRA